MARWASCDARGTMHNEGQQAICSQTSRVESNNGYARSDRLRLGAEASRPSRSKSAAVLQFDIGDYLGPVETIKGIDFRFGPVFAAFITARLRRTPNGDDQRVLSEALAMIEDRYAFSPEGVFSFVAYGLPYFRRLPQALVREHMPRLASSPNRFALEEAIPSPTDVS